ncbi:MAG: hypothetical protein JSV50_22450 [Desulfobacteraceae bacterium]|nr:MAG: hypothetical protein JSV50_22450 [Desulfobacteraceae bacterium]
MAMLFGQKFTRSDLLQRVGNIFQVAGVRLMTLEDGWIYFIHGWTQVIGEAFNIDITQNDIERLSAIAKKARE